MLLFYESAGVQAPGYCWTFSREGRELCSAITRALLRSRAVGSSPPTTQGPGRARPWPLSDQHAAPFSSHDFPADTHQIHTPCACPTCLPSVSSSASRLVQCLNSASRHQALRQMPRSEVANTCLSSLTL